MLRMKGEIMKTKKKHSLAVGIAFVGFVTQFGGGFASGTQIYQYFINYGAWTFIMPIVAQAILSIFYWYGMRYAFRNKTFDYRSFSDKFYGKYKKIGSNLYELEYFLMVSLAPAVAFATGGATLQALTGIPYIICTLFIGLIIFGLTIFGTDLIRKFSIIISIFIIIGLVVILLPNILIQSDTIILAIKHLQSGLLPVGSAQNGSFGSALFRACNYGIFQLTAIGLMYQHTNHITDEKEIARSMFYMFIIDTLVMELSILGLLAVAYLPELATVSVPMLLMVQTGVGAKIFTPIISLLIFLGAVSTGVNMIAGIVERAVNQLEKRKKNRLYYGIIAMFFTVVTFSIAQFGLIPLVSKGYSYIGLMTLIVIVIPFVLHFIHDKAQEKKKDKESPYMKNEIL